MTYDFTVFPVRDRLNDRLVREVPTTGPTSYTTGGVSVNADSLGLARVFGLYGVLNSGSAYRQPVLVQATQLVQFFVPDTGAEVANGTDLSTFTGTLLITGK